MKVPVLILSFFSLVLSAQENKTFVIPKVDLKTTEGKTFYTDSLQNLKKPFIICFWKSCCRGPNKLLDSINEEYENWNEETDLQVFVVSTDDSRSSSRVKPFIDAKGWEFTVLLDPNGDFKRAMNINTVPFIIMFDSKMNIIWQKSTFNEGDFEVLNEKVNQFKK